MTPRVPRDRLLLRGTRNRRETRRFNSCYSADYRGLSIMAGLSFESNDLLRSGRRLCILESKISRTGFYFSQIFQKFPKFSFTFSFLGSYGRRFDAFSSNYDLPGVANLSKCRNLEKTSKNVLWRFVRSCLSFFFSFVGENCGDISFYHRKLLY